MWSPAHGSGFAGPRTCFSHEADARRFLDAMRARLAEFALSPHPEKTRRDRMQAKLQEIKEELRQHRHQAIDEQGAWLRLVVRGFFNYHAVPTNSRALSVFRHYVTVLWQRTLRRRSQKDRFSWDRISRLVDEWLPRPRILHPQRSVRFAARHKRWEPYAGKPHVRFCAGGAQYWASLPRSGPPGQARWHASPAMTVVGRPASL